MAVKTTLENSSYPKDNKLWTTPGFKRYEKIIKQKQTELDQVRTNLGLIQPAKKKSKG